MDLGFETCGNATLIAYDRGTPVLATDPWIRGPQYFGSWSLAYEFTPEQQAAFAATRYVWFSHGHPDHLNLDSLEAFRGRTVLLPRHHGGRIASDLMQAGYQVQTLPSGEWVSLSERVSVYCRGDWNQDAALLVAFDGRCGVLNLNDGSALGTEQALAQELKAFRRRFVLRLINYGDADMMNFFTEGGERIKPMIGEKKSLGHVYSALLRQWGGTHTAPFSCHHTYSRTDSSWAAQYETPLEAHGERFDSSRGEFIPGYFSYDVARDRIEMTPAKALERRYREPAEFGDDWSDVLDEEDRKSVAGYFGKFGHLKRKFEFVNCRVGGRDNVVPLGGPRGKGVTFEVPRHSLVTALRFEIFDDLLIGNFMKTTLHGGVRSLYPDFTPYVAKYGDNGRAYSDEELRRYFVAYRGSGLLPWLEQMKVESARRLRQNVLGLLAHNRALYVAARRAYGYLRK